MTQGSWEDVRAHGSKRLLPYFTGTPGRFPRLAALPPSPIVPSSTPEEERSE